VPFECQDRTFVFGFDVKLRGSTKYLSMRLWGLSARYQVVVRPIRRLNRKGKVWSDSGVRQEQSLADEEDDLKIKM